MGTSNWIGDPSNWRLMADARGKDGTGGDECDLVGPLLLLEGLEYSFASKDEGYSRWGQDSRQGE